MKKAKKILLLGLLCCGLVFSHGIPSMAEEAPQGIQAGTSLTVGVVTPFAGHFGTEFFGDNASDMDARLLLHGYSVVGKDRTPGTSTHAVAVRDLAVQDAGGSRVYTITFAPGLTYNDGTPITARDYAFALLLAASPQLLEVGGTADPLDHIQGYESYHAGKAKAFAGVRLISDTQLSIAVDAAHTPYFYELTLLATQPYPISVIAPGCEVADDGQGVYLRASSSASGTPANGYQPGVFSADMLRKTLLDPKSGYEFAPKVTSGPYQFTTYDATSGQAVFTANPAFAGDENGMTPHIERLTVVPVTNDTMFGLLESGKVQLVNKIASRDALVQAQEISTSNPGVTGTPYLRSGLTFISFACEQGPAASVSVRRAIAMTLDKDALVNDMMGGVAIRAYGYYGVGQWMASYTGYSQEDSILDSLKRLDITKDVAAANKLLDSDGWTFDAQGNLWQSGVRHREAADGSFEPLLIRFAKPLENKAAAHVEKALREGLAEIGASLETAELPFEELLRHYYRLEDRTYDLFFLATNFGYVFDPYYDFHTGDTYQGAVNKTGLRDDELMSLAQRMRSTDPSDLDGYMDAWLAFQKRFIEVLPLVPLYSGIYMDVASANLMGYDILQYSSWAQAIVNAWIAPAN